MRGRDGDCGRRGVRGAGGMRACCPAVRRSRPRRRAASRARPRPARRPSRGDVAERRAGGRARRRARKHSALQPLTLDFDELVDELVAEAAARTGADAVVLRVEGPGGRPVIASFGRGRGERARSSGRSAPLDDCGRSAPRRSTGRTAPRASRRTSRSSRQLVTPLGAIRRRPRARSSPTRRAPNAFRPEHAQRSCTSSSPRPSQGLANARRFAEVEARVTPRSGDRRREPPRLRARARPRGRPRRADGPPALGRARRHLERLGDDDHGHPQERRPASRDSSRA